MIALVEASQETLVYKTVFHWMQKCIPELLELLSRWPVRASSLRGGTQNALEEKSSRCQVPFA